MLISNVASAMLIKYCDDDHEDDNDGADEIDDDSFPEERGWGLGVKQMASTTSNGHLPPWLRCFFLLFFFTCPLG